VEFRVLGPLEVVHAGQPVALGAAKQRAALALLVLNAPEPVSAERLIDELWGERPPASAQHAAQVYVSGIRKVLGAAGGEAMVRSSASGYALEVDVGRVDARRFERLVGQAQHALADDPARARELFEQAVGLWRGRPMAEFERFEFARREADRFEDLHTIAVEGLVEARLGLGEHTEVIATMTGLVAAEPLRERPRRLLMLALYRAGRHAEALAAYRDARAALDEIGLQPGPELRQLEQAILRHDPSLATPTPGAGAFADASTAARLELIGPLSGGRSRLPSAAHALVGRRSEMSSVLELLARGDVRLVTVLGPGGSGKTRLALEAATEQVDRYRDGVWFVSLGPLGDPGLVVSEIARTVGVGEAEGQPLPVTLANALERRELLLVLDNFEHLLAAAGLVSELLAAAPGLDVLVTSRQALNLNGENRIEVGGLPPADAAELFLERARAVRRDLAVGAQEREAVERICLRLDGLPLALELAAARVALFSVSALEARLAQRLELPEGARDLPARQRTLRATIDWSYQLLSPRERRLFGGLAPFAGGARLEAIESTFTDLGVEPVEAVAALVDKSLLRRRDDTDGLPRFWMLETIREYASERLAKVGQAKTAAARHAAYFFDLAEEAEPNLRTAIQSVWLARLEADHDNLRAAFDYLAVQEPPQALRMAAALGRFWEIHGHLSEGRERLRRTIASSPEGGAAAAKASNFAGFFAYLQGETLEAEPLFSAAVRLARQARERRVEALALSNLGKIAQGRGDVARSTELQEEALVVAREANDDRLLTSALNNVGFFLAETGVAERGRALLEESLEIARRLGETMAVALAAGNLAELALVRGDLNAAESLTTESLECAREIDAGPLIGWALSLQAVLALIHGALATADARIREGLRCTLAAYRLESGLIALAAAAALAAARSEPLLAAQLWAALDGELRAHGIDEGLTVTRLREQWLPKARGAVDAATWEAAWAVGGTQPRRSTRTRRQDVNAVRA
jgi:predicted ATPase/DNA-binding SARP family transcriptional activator